MPIVLYQIPASPPCRAVMMTAEHLGIKLEMKYVDLFAGEQLKPEFLEKNPQHAVPTIDDDGFYLSESRAIQAYLVNQYAPDSPLYPRDPKARAIVDRMLYFDVGTLHNALAAYMRPQMFQGLPADPVKEENVKKALAVFEKILEKSPYAAGKHLTLADYSILSNVDMVEEIIGYSYEEYPKISAWLQRMKKETPKYKEINEIPLQKFKEYLKSRK